MFDRVDFGSTKDLIAIAALLLSFGAFLIICWRAIRMKKDEREHKANLPLEDEDNHPSPDNSSDHERKQ